MLNLIKMDLYRMEKSKSTWVLTAISGIITIFMVFFTGISSTLQSTSEGTTIVSMYSSMIQGANLVLLLIIFNVLFTSGKATSGFIKNIDGKVSLRFKYIVSETVTSIVFILMNFLVMAIFTAISAPFFIKGVTFGDATGLLYFLPVQLLLYITFSAFAICVTTLIQSTGFSMAFLILYSFMIGSLLYYLIDYIISHVLNLSVNFYISDLTILSNISAVGTEYSADVYLRAILVGVVIFLVASAISVVTITKRDIK